jgi:PHD/YefM family antitoxin component YafN of YafNO toxin-antitoxin module
MITTAPQYITDRRGKRVSVILPMKEYERILEELEDQEDVRLYDEAKSEGEEYVPAEEVFRFIEAKRNKLCLTK